MCCLPSYLHAPTKIHATRIFVPISVATPAVNCMGFRTNRTVLSMSPSRFSYASISTPLDYCACMPLCAPSHTECLPRVSDYVEQSLKHRESSTEDPTRQRKQPEKNTLGEKKIVAAAVKAEKTKL
ncbi:hypothetical protein GUJ93_ZPchr0008g11756 [Zizania palustris]|uniref:Uncharacterized protein n=1 Tax=Zizania palustris TaxID=103762 RepID=A0A8J5RD08_ZIZPA|nr:hypothetical protein GUJ93_ZPchr0008g11756 [Zizania palustris]